MRFRSVRRSLLLVLAALLACMCFNCAGAEGKAPAAGGRLEIQSAVYSGGVYSFEVLAIPEKGISMGWPELKICNARFEAFGLGESRREDGSSLFYMEGLILGEPPEVLEGEVSLEFGWRPGEKTLVTAPLRLEHDVNLRAWLRPQGKAERWTVISARLSVGAQRATLDVQYWYEPLPEEDESGVDMRLLDADGQDISMGSVNEWRTGQIGERSVYRSVTMLEPIKVLPDKLYLCLRTLDDEQYLDAIECAVEAY